SAGDFDTILDEAERDIGHVLATRGTEDLAALADAARYRRHDDVARRALLAQRRRFAGSPRAADAAFFLGRLDENGGRGHGPALAWYERYLDEAPRGSYVAEALGRKMIAVEELHGAAAAHNVAEQYLRRFPRGSYAGASRAQTLPAPRVILLRPPAAPGAVGEALVRLQAELTVEGFDAQVTELGL